MEDLDVMDALLDWEDRRVAFGAAAATKAPMLATGTLSPPPAVDTASAAFVDAAAGETSPTLIDNEVRDLFDDIHEQYYSKKVAAPEAQLLPASYYRPSLLADGANDIYALLADEDPEQESFEVREYSALPQINECTLPPQVPEQPALLDILNEIRHEAHEIERRSASKSPEVYQMVEMDTSLHHDQSYASMDSQQYSQHSEDSPYSSSQSPRSYPDDDEDTIIECGESSDSDYSDYARATPKRSSKPSVRRGRVGGDKKERKKEQNRRAAQRYREKKQALKSTASGELDHLLKRNSTLRATLGTLQTEINIMKKLLSEVQSAA